MIKTIVVDTLNGIQQDEWMEMQKKAGHDEWLDFGKDIYTFILALQKRGFEIVEVPGYEGSGKSYGMKGLKKSTNIWFNCDKKNPTWEGGREEYGTKTAPTKYHVLPNGYDAIIKHIDATIAGGFLDKNPIAFLTCHIEDFKSGTETRQRMKTLGKVATKMNIEGKMENVFYSKIVREGNTTKYYLATKNNGFNTGRSSEGMFKEELIPNNFQLIVDALDKLNGIVPQKN
jgi:hypothetical protein